MSSIFLAASFQSVGLKNPPIPKPCGLNRILNLHAQTFRSLVHKRQTCKTLTINDTAGSYLNISILTPLDNCLYIVYQSECF